jgi:recombination protein RecA
MSLALLRQRITEIVEGPRPDSGSGLPTGFRALDEALAGGGVPRGRLTEIVGARGSGRTTLVRQLVEETARAGGGVAVIDAQRTLSPADWVSSGSMEDVLFVRPRDGARAAWCADVLLRSGAFTLVVLDGVRPLSRNVAVMLTLLARDAAAALVVVGATVGSSEARGATVGGAVRLRCRSARGVTRGTRWRGARGGRESEVFQVVIEKGGDHRIVEVDRAVPVARRLCTHSEIPDRRGVARTGAGRAGAHGVARAAAAQPPAAGRVGARSRRCAEVRTGAGGIFGG